MKHLALSIACAIFGYGAPVTVTISGPVYTPAGVAANGGTVTAGLAAPCTIGSEYVARGPVVATIASDGTLSMSLVATASCDTAGNYYTVRYRATRTGVPLTEYTETWTVPVLPSSTTIAAVRSATIPNLLAAVSWTQLTSIPTPISSLIATAAANRVFAGPSSGAAAVGAYRALVAADLPSLTGLTLLNDAAATTLVIGGGSSGTYSRIHLLTDSTHTNWKVAVQDSLSGGLEITPSTVVGGSTFTTPALSIFPTVTIAPSLRVSGLSGGGSGTVCVDASGNLSRC